MPLVLLHVTPHIVEVLVVLTCATLIRSVFGFGEALVAVPLLALIMPIETAAPLATLVSITVAAIVLVQDWSEVHVRSAGLVGAFNFARDSSGPTASDKSR